MVMLIGATLREEITSVDIPLSYVVVLLLGLSCLLTFQHILHYMWDKQGRNVAV